MKFKWIFLILMMSLLLFLGVADAKSPYGKMDVYYNDRLLPGSEVAKPTLKIGETFTVRVDLTVYQTSFVNVELTEVGDNNYVIINGPTKKMGDYTGLITLNNNSTRTYEWKLAPTVNWAGGSMPVNLHYEILDPSSPEPLVSSSFTIAIPYISTEYYEGDSTPTTTTNPDSPTSTESPNSIPAFTLITTALAIALATRKQ